MNLWGVIPDMDGWYVLYDNTERPNTVRVKVDFLHNGTRYITLHMPRTYGAVVTLTTLPRGWELFGPLPDPVVKRGCTETFFDLLGRPI